VARTSRWLSLSCGIDKQGVAALSIVHSILQHYVLPEVLSVDYLGGNGGFSGAQLWKLGTADGSYCLRRWPLSHPTRERLEWINLVLVHTAGMGCEFIPAPLETKSSGRFISAGGFFWEVTKWMEGTACFNDDPNEARLSQVAASLAKFHLASAQVNLGFERSKNLQARHEAMASSASLLDALSRCSKSGLPDYIYRLRALVLGLGSSYIQRIRANLEPMREIVFPVQPVVRDIWHDHLIFRGDELSGLVDFGAMQMDSVACDLSRALGSIVKEDKSRWEYAINVYSQSRPLTQQEIDLIYILDQPSAFLGALNWLNWILIEERVFESEADVKVRIMDLTSRLEASI